MAQVPSNLIPISITQLPVPLTTSEDTLLVGVYQGITYKIRAGDLLQVAGVPTSRQVIAGTGLTGGGQLSSNVTLSIAPGGVGTTQLAATGVTPGVYGDATSVPQFTVDATGRVTAATSVPLSISGYVPTSRQVIAGNGLTGGGALSSNVTLAVSYGGTPLAGSNSGAAGTALTLSRSDHQHPAVDLASDAQVDGILGLQSGGTARSLTMQPGAVIWSGSDGMYVSAAGVAGQVLVSGGTGAPTWGSTLILAPVAANSFFAGPTSGGVADPTFRAMVNTDLPNSGAVANTYGSGTQVPVLVVNSKGVITSASMTDVTPAWANITGKPTTLSGYGITDALGLTTAAPSALAASASVGTATSAARADHVHALPTPAAIGAVATTAVGAANGVAGLGADGKVPTSQLPDVAIGGLNYQGTWNASTNTPTIPTASSSNKGFYYKVATAGATNVSGTTDWQIGDWIVSNGSTWDKIDNTDSVSSVNGATGAVTITTITGNAGTATKLLTARTIAMTGDVSWTSAAFDGSANVTGSATLASTGVAAASYGSGALIPTFTVDAKGRLTAAGTTTNTPAWSSVTGKPTTLAGYGITDGVTLTGTQALTNKTIDASLNTLTNIPNSALSFNTISGVQLGNNLFALTIGSGLGGVSYNGSAAVTITNTGVLSNVAGTGISVSGATGNVTITNTAPDQTVVLNGAGTTVVTGTYPNFTITSSDQYVGTVTSVGTGTGLTGGPITTTGTISFSVPSVGTWAATPSSANLAAAMTDETGSGSLVFANGPVLSGPTIDGANPYIQFSNGAAVALAAGRLWYDGATGSWNAGMGGGNITQQIGEELFVYGKASAAITDSPLRIVYKTGTVGGSGVITFGPTVAGITDGDAIIGVATEPIALNGFGRVTSYGVVRGITTDGAAYGETWVDGDVIWYNPVTGNPTNVKPSAPNIKVSVGVLIKASNGGSGSIQVEINHGSVLGGTDSNVQITGTPVDKSLLQYDLAVGYWKNVTAASVSIGTATNLAGGAAGSVPYQTGAGTTAMLALGTTNYVLTAGASAPQYVAQSSLSVGSATNATNATNTGTTADSTNATNYLVFKSATTGNLPELVNSGLTVNPSTGKITGGISGGTF